jgi:DNA repair protein RadC
MKAVYETRFARVGETSAHYSRKINGTNEAKGWALDCMGEYFGDRRDQEEVVVALLNTKNVVTRVVRVTRGTLDTSLAHPREVFRAAVQDAASGLILLHNHPSGDPSPSGADVVMTKRMIEAGQILGINVIDHIVVGDGTAVSLREMGLI